MDDLARVIPVVSVVCFEQTFSCRHLKVRLRHVYTRSLVLQKELHMCRAVPCKQQFSYKLPMLLQQAIALKGCGDC
jgi:hypothetical protein